MHPQAPLSPVLTSRSQGIFSRRFWQVLLAMTVALVASAQAATKTIYQVNCGGSAASPYVSDTNFSGGSTFSVGNTIDTSAVTSAAPQLVYQSERFGACTYTFPSLTSTSNYQVRLHFSENYNTTAGARQFNVLINGTTVLTNFDIYAAAGARYKAVVQEFSVAASSGQIVVQFQNGAADFAKIDGIEIIDLNYVPPSFCLNVDIDKGSSYTGVGAAPDAGTTWNEFSVSSQATPYVLTNLLSSLGIATSGSVILNSSGGSLSSWTASSPGNPNPLALMSDYIFGNTYTVAVTSLPAGNYFLYVYAHGDQSNQNSTVTVDAGNGGGTGITATTGTDYRNIFASGAQGYSYLRFPVSVTASGTLKFTSASYLNGFQVMDYPKASFAIQPPANGSVTLNSNFSVTVSGTGEGTLSYQWQKGGVNLTDGATGNGSTFSGAATPTLALTNAQFADAGNYAVVVTNLGGAVTSSTMALTVTASALAPSIANQPSNQTVLSGSAASFSVTANGTAPLAYQWYKGATPLANGTTAQGSTISGATAAALNITNTKLADAGSYSVVVTNAPATTGTATSTSATLTVNQAPAITTQPTGAVVGSGSTFTLSPSFDPGSPAPSYQWQKTLDGLNYSNVSGATSASLTLTGSTSTSGFYRVVATNSVGSVTSSVVYVGVTSTSLGSPILGPGNTAGSVNRDTPLTLTFSAKPTVGATGAVRVFDASNNQQVAVIDLSQISAVSLTANSTSYGVYHYSTKVIQGDNYYTQPIVAIGSQPAPSQLPAGSSPAINQNQVIITLPSSTTLSYGKSYYVTIDPGVLVDANGATYPGISDSTTWRFTVKSSGPSNGASSLTVGNDGTTTDFSTVQGAADFLATYSPQPSAASRVTMNIRNGIYYEVVHFKTSYVTIQGQSRSGTVVAYLLNNNTINAPGAPTGSVRTRPPFRIDDGSSYVTVQNLSIYNLTPNGGSQAEAFLPGGTFGIANHVSVYSYQDTMLLGNGFFMTDSYVEGAVDYIWGGSAAYFQRCELKANSVSSYYTQSRNAQTAKGYAFVNCVLDAYPSVTGSGCYLSRTFNDYSQTIYINCKMGTHINPQGWLIASGSTPTLQLWEYQSKDLNGNLLDVSQRTSFNRAYAVSGTSLVYTPGSTSNDVLDHQQVSATLANLFSTPTAFFGNWTPTVAPTLDTAPASQNANPGQAVTFTAAATAVPDPTYQWYKNGVAIPAATGSTYTLASVSGTDWANYTVVAVNTSGSASATASLTVNDPEAIWANQAGLDPATTGAPTADPDNDGLQNKLEFFLGKNPAVADPAGSLPILSSTNNGAAMVFEFNRLKAASALSYTVDYATDLSGTWSPATPGVNGVTVDVTSVDANFDRIKVTIPASGPRGFARLRL